MSEEQPNKEKDDAAIYDDVVRIPILLDIEVYEWFKELTPDYKFLMAAVLKRFMKGCKKTLSELNSHDIHVIMDEFKLD